jgi:twinkle protein
MEAGEGESWLVGKGPCEDCGSSDACAEYEHDDGRRHTHCFSCDAHHWLDGAGPSTSHRKRTVMEDFIEGEFRALPSRNLSEDTCRKFGIKVGLDSKGNPVSLFDYRDAATGLDVVAQKMRYPGDKENMPFIGSPKKAGLFGQHLWKSGGKRVVVTEGEFDAASVAQAFNLTWPVVSIKRGCKGAVEDIKQSLEWLESYDSVVFWFDADKHGREAVQRCAGLLTPGKVKIVETPQ